MMISKRAWGNRIAGEDFESIVKVLANTYDKETNPDGVVSLGIAENCLMHNELVEYFNNVKIQPRHLTYWDGPFGSRGLRAGLSDLFNQHFQPRRPVLPEHIITAAGVTAVIDLITFGVADPGDAILLGRPLYTSFYNDLTARCDVNLVPVSAEDKDPMGLDMVHNFDEELRLQQSRGVKTSAIILSNPQNPLGKCYSRETIIAYMSLCGRYGIHFISDEVYALSIFDNPEYPDATKFTSALSIDTEGIIDPDLVHVLYGMSKDFGSNGFRCGVLVSQTNMMLRKCIKSIACFTWTSSVAEHMLATLLQDKPFLEYYLAENSRRLAENYSIVVQFLRAHGIDYVAGGNSGFFIWGDFRPLLGPDFVVKYTDPPGAAENGGQTPRIHRFGRAAAARDAWFVERLEKARVFIATGSAFFSEEHGFYRITFSMPKDTLALGLKRLSAAIQTARDDLAREDSDTN